MVGREPHVIILIRCVRIADSTNAITEMPLPRRHYCRALSMPCRWKWEKKKGDPKVTQFSYRLAGVRQLFDQLCQQCRIILRTFHNAVCRFRHTLVSDTRSERGDIHRVIFRDAMLPVTLLQLDRCVCFVTSLQHFTGHVRPIECNIRHDCRCTFRGLRRQRTAGFIFDVHHSYHVIVATSPRICMSESYRDIAIVDTKPCGSFIPRSCSRHANTNRLHPNPNTNEHAGTNTNEGTNDSHLHVPTKVRIRIIYIRIPGVTPPWGQR